MNTPRPNYQEWYRNAHPELTQAGLWLRGGELNTLPPDEYERRFFRALFVRLSTYVDTGYSFTHQYLYQLAANTPGVFPDLAYLPPRADLPIFERDGVPWLLGTQSKQGPSGFDLIGFSNSITQELINVPSFLLKSGIPPLKSERLERPELPLLVLGGANALYSSALWLDQAMVDGIFVGEDDQSIRRLLEICRDGKEQNLEKGAILERLEESVPGFFQPDRPGKKGRKNFAPDLNRSEALERAPVYFLEEPLGSSHLQISEGCPCFCSFCAESWERRPYRERGAQALAETALKLKAAMGLDTIELYSFNFNMHSEFYQVIWDLAPHFRHIGLKSQRFDLLAHDPEMLRFQHVLEKTSLTCGLEGISPRLRTYLNKNLGTEDLHKSLEAIFRNKAREMKVFLIATGLEEEQDFVALGDLLEHMNDLRRARDSKTRIIFSMTPLVRFPWTPLEFEDAFTIDHYERIIRKAAGRVRGAGFEFRESADLPEYWVSQILVRASKQGVSRALQRAIDRTGFVYYREITRPFMETLDAALREEGLDPSELLKGFSLEESADKPWTRVETGVKRDFLWKMNQEVRAFTETDYCLGRSWTQARCAHCGACPTRFHVRAIVLSEQKRGYTLEQFQERRRRAQLQEKKLDFLVTVGDSARGVARKFAGVALARALMLAVPELVPHYRGYAGAFWADEDRGVWITGRDVISLYWDQRAVAVLETVFKDPEKLRRVHEQARSWLTFEGFAPAGWSPSLLEIQTPWEIRLDPYLKARGLKYTLRKQADTSYIFELIPQSRKKGILNGVRTLRPSVREGQHQGYLELGPKFDLREFVNEALLWNKASSPALLRLHSR